MPRLDYKNCRECGRPSNDVGALSHTRLCGTCAANRYVDNLDQITARSGPFYVHWLRRRHMETHRRLLDVERGHT